MNLTYGISFTQMTVPRNIHHRHQGTTQQHISASQRNLQASDESAYMQVMLATYSLFSLHTYSEPQMYI